MTSKVMVQAERMAEAASREGMVLCEGCARFYVYRPTRRCCGCLRREARHAEAVAALGLAPEAAPQLMSLRPMLQPIEQDGVTLRQMVGYTLAGLLGICVVWGVVLVVCVWAPEAAKF